MADLALVIPEGAVGAEVVGAFNVRVEEFDVYTARERDERAYGYEFDGKF